MNGRYLQPLLQERWAGRGGVRGFCRDTGIQPSTVYAWFRGAALPELGTVAVVARALEMPCWAVVAVMAGEDVGGDLSGS
jgi:hypothetical protein